jgi:hypothetical protein
VSWLLSGLHVIPLAPGEPAGIEPDPYAGDPRPVGRYGGCSPGSIVVRSRSPNGRWPFLPAWDLLPTRFPALRRGCC